MRYIVASLSRQLREGSASTRSRCWVEATSILSVRSAPLKHPLRNGVFAVEDLQRLSIHTCKCRRGYFSSLLSNHRFLNHPVVAQNNHRKQQLVQAVGTCGFTR